MMFSGKRRQAGGARQGRGGGLRILQSMIFPSKGRQEAGVGPLLGLHDPPVRIQLVPGTGAEAKTLRMEVFGTIGIKEPEGAPEATDVPVQDSDDQFAFPVMVVLQISRSMALVGLGRGDAAGTLPERRRVQVPRHLVPLQLPLGLLGHAGNLPYQGRVGIPPRPIVLRRCVSETLQLVSPDAEPKGKCKA
jgi:hypothetical protein